MSVSLMASCQKQDQREEERRGTRGDERRKGETQSMTGRETLKQNRCGSKGERDTRKPGKPSPEPALAGFCTRETGPHRNFPLSPEDTQCWQTTAHHLLSLSPDFLLRAAHFRKEEPQWAPGIENTISASEIRRNRAPWDTRSEFSFSLGWGFWGEFSSQFSEGQTEKKSSPEIHLRQVVR